MQKLSLDQIDILVIDPDATIRGTIRNLLQDNGFRKITVGSSMADIEHKFRLNLHDLVISDLKLPDGNLFDFIYRLRHHEVGYNPFLPIIVTSWNPTQDDVRGIIQAGADDLITKPLSAAQLLNRIKALIVSRKPFVVTSNYIGPDRRPKEKRDASPEIVPVPVPNILKAKATAKTGESLDLSIIQAEIDKAVKKVNLQKLDRHASQVSFLVDRIVPGLAFGGPDETTSRALNRLLYLAEDTARRMVGTPYGHVSEICQNLINVTSRILDAGDFPSPKDVNLLKPLAQAIQSGFRESGEGAENFAHEISSTLTT